MERRLLYLELFPEYGPDAERIIPASGGSNRFHFPLDPPWNEAPQPSARARLVLDAVGCNWRDDGEPTF